MLEHLGGLGLGFISWRLGFCDQTLGWNCDEEEERTSCLEGCVQVILAYWIFLVVRVLLISPN
jgi:hypothetical protein